MSKNEEYIDFGAGYVPGGRKQGSGALILGIILVVILAIISGIAVYHVLSKKPEVLPEQPSNQELEHFVSEERKDPTPTPTLTPTVTPSPTDTPSPTPSPTPFVRPGFEDAYLSDFDQNTRNPLAKIEKAGYNLSEKYPVPEDFKVKGAYVANIKKGTENYEYLTWVASNTELNALIIDVKNDRGRITYEMDLESARSIGMCVDASTKEGIGDAKAMLEDLHSKGIYCIARIVAFRDDKGDTSPLYEAHPDWFLHKKDGTLYRDSGSYMWLNPYNREACSFIVDIAEQAINDGFDEICFDYIRSANSWPASINYGGEHDNVGIIEQIARFTKYACNSLKPLGAYVSASVFGTVIVSNADAAILGQGYTEMAKYLDAICPMIYPSHYAAGYAGITDPNANPYELVDFEMSVSTRKLKALKEEYGYAAVCRPWLQAFNWGKIKYDYGMLRLMVDACRDNEVYSFMYWNAAGNYEYDAFAMKEDDWAYNESLKNKSSENEQ